MCDFRNGTWECRGDGHLWDADQDGWDPEECDHPCPKCNTKAFLLDRKEEAESVSSGSDCGFRFTGESIWLDAVETAELHNLEAAQIALGEIGLVEALRPANNAEQYEDRKSVV